MTHSEAVLPVLILFKESGVVDYDLCISNLEVHDLFVNCFS